MKARGILFVLTFVFAACGSHGSPPILPRSSDAAIKPFSTQARPDTLTGQHLYALDEAGELRTYDLFGNETTPHLAWMYSIQAAAIANGKIYLENLDSRSITTFNSDGSQAQPTILNLPPQTSLETKLAADANGNVYLCDPSNGTIFSYGPNGTRNALNITGLQDAESFAVNAAGTTIFVAEKTASQVLTYDASGNQTPLVITQGVHLPTAVDVDAHGTVYVASLAANGAGRITTYAADGSRGSLTIATNGAPVSLAVGGRGKIYVVTRAPKQRDLLTIYAPDGSELSAFPVQFSTAVLPDANGNVLEFGYFQAVEFTQQGVPTGFVIQGPTARNYQVSSTGNVVAVLFGIHKRSVQAYAPDGSLVSPSFSVWQEVSGIGMDSNDNIYLVDGSHGTIGVYNRNGRFMRHMHPPGVGDSSSILISGNKMYLWGNDTVRVYTLLGVPVLSFAIGSTPYSPYIGDLAVGSDGTIDVLTEQGGSGATLLKYSAAGVQISSMSLNDTLAYAVATDRANNVYVSTAVPFTVEVFSPGNALLRTLNNMPDMFTGGMRIH